MGQMVMGEWFVTLMCGVAAGALEAPSVVADGSGPVVLDHDAMVALGRVKLPHGLVICSRCGTEQRPGAVHFPSLTAMRPCPASWSSR